VLPATAPAVAVVAPSISPEPSNSKQKHHHHHRHHPPRQLISPHDQKLERASASVIAPCAASPCSSSSSSSSSSPPSAGDGASGGGPTGHHSASKSDAILRTSARDGSFFARGGPVRRLDIGGTGQQMARPASAGSAAPSRVAAGKMVLAAAVCAAAAAAAADEDDGRPLHAGTKEAVDAVAVCAAVSLPEASAADCISAVQVAPKNLVTAEGAGAATRLAPGEVIVKCEQLSEQQQKRRRRRRKRKQLHKARRQEEEKCKHQEEQAQQGAAEAEQVPAAPEPKPPAHRERAVPNLEPGSKQAGGIAQPAAQPYLHANPALLQMGTVRFSNGETVEIGSGSDDEDEEQGSKISRVGVCVPPPANMRAEVLQPSARALMDHDAIAATVLAEVVDRVVLASMPPAEEEATCAVRPRSRPQTSPRAASASATTAKFFEGGIQSAEATAEVEARAALVSIEARMEARFKAAMAEADAHKRRAALQKQRVMKGLRWMVDLNALYFRHNQRGSNKPPTDKRLRQFIADAARSERLRGMCEANVGAGGCPLATELKQVLFNFGNTLDEIELNLFGPRSESARPPRCRRRGRKASATAAAAAAAAAHAAGQAADRAHESIALAARKAAAAAATACAASAASAAAAAMAVATAAAAPGALAQGTVQAVAQETAAVTDDTSSGLEPQSEIGDCSAAAVPVIDLDAVAEAASHQPAKSKPPRINIAELRRNAIAAHASSKPETLGGALDQGGEKQGKSSAASLIEQLFSLVASTPPRGAGACVYKPKPSHWLVSSNLSAVMSTGLLRKHDSRRREHRSDSSHAASSGGSSGGSGANPFARRRSSTSDGSGGSNDGGNPFGRVRRPDESVGDSGSPATERNQSNNCTRPSSAPEVDASGRPQPRRPRRSSVNLTVTHV